MFLLYFCTYPKKKQIAIVLCHRNKFFCIILCIVCNNIINGKHCKFIYAFKFENLLIYRDNQLIILSVDCISTTRETVKLWCTYGHSTIMDTYISYHTIDMSYLLSFDKNYHQTNSPALLKGICPFRFGAFRLHYEDFTVASVEKKSSTRMTRTMQAKKEQKEEILDDAITVKSQPSEKDVRYICIWLILFAVVIIIVMLIFSNVQKSSNTKDTNDDSISSSNSSSNNKEGDDSSSWAGVVAVLGAILVFGSTGRCRSYVYYNMITITRESCLKNWHLLITMIQ